MQVDGRTLRKGELARSRCLRCSPPAVFQYALFQYAFEGTPCHHSWLIRWVFPFFRSNRQAVTFMDRAWFESSQLSGRARIHRSAARRLRLLKKARVWGIRLAFHRK